MKKRKSMMALFLAASVQCWSGASAASPRRLDNFGEVLEALRSGREVRAVLDYSRCSLFTLKKSTASNAGPRETTDPACALTVQNKPETCYHGEDGGLDAVGGMRVDTWEYFGRGFISPKAYIAASEAKLISIRGFVTNYAALRVYEDGAVTVKVNYLKTADGAGEGTAQETPLTARRDGSGVSARKLSPHEHIIVMDELFRCEISGGRDDKGASFFAAP